MLCNISRPYSEQYPVYTCQKLRCINCLQQCSQRFTEVHRTARKVNTFYRDTGRCRGTISKNKKKKKKKNSHFYSAISHRQGEHTALYKINKNVYIKTLKIMIIYSKFTLFNVVMQLLFYSFPKPQVHREFRC